MESKVFKKNRERLAEKLDDNSVVILFSGKAPKKIGDENYDFTPNRNFYYLTGIDEENDIILIAKINNIVTEKLFIKEIDLEKERWIGKSLRKNEAEDISAINEILYLNDFKPFINKIFGNNNNITLFLDFERDDFDSLSTTEESFAQEVSKKYPHLWIKKINSYIRELRLIKSKEEVDYIKKAISITIKGVNELMKKSKAGIKEYQLEAYFDFECKTNGATDYAFKTIAAAGKNAATLHYVDNNSDINDGDLILFDLGAQYNYYNADITRTFPANGKFTKRQKEVYSAVLRVNEAVINAIKPGVKYKELNEWAKGLIAKECINLGLIKSEDEVSKYYWHSIGHSLGLETHDVDSPKRDTVFKEGMVWTVEPGIYIGEEEIGIRIEDNVLVTKNGVEVLTKNMIKYIQDIEKFMK